MRNLNSEPSPQVEDGFVRIANELFDQFCQLDISSALWSIVHLVVRNTYGYNRKYWTTSNSEISNILKTGRNRVSENLKELQKRNILKVVPENRNRNGVTIGLNKHYGTWIFVPENRIVPENRNKLFRKTGTVPLKTNKDKRTSVGFQKTEKNDKVPYDEIIDIYNSKFGERFVAANKLLFKQSKTRMGNLRARWMTSEKTQSVEWWREFFEGMEESRFLMGQVRPTNGHRQFVLSLDWVLKLENFTKIIEGRYNS